ncbi:hypothetical protein LPY66_08515 [Dehalobacter sp. DCM]|uniref:hypothetical protein n=1 Tax=Dehalobacter sp. DCM TaxID=2907827 RepID=UPI003081A481|nr:hypothetical protein LPY66_08515 [Dehalobacter sp. DCM]
MAEKKGPSFIKAVLMAVGILAVGIAITIGLSMVGFGSWLLILTLVYFLSVEQLNYTMVPHVVVGSFVGITYGFGINLATMALGFVGVGANASTIGLVVYLVLVVFAIACNVANKLPVLVNKCMWFIMIAFMIPGANDMKYLVPDYAVWLITSVIVIILGMVIKKAASRSNKLNTPA